MALFLLLGPCFKENEIKNSEFTKKILDNCIAIPIWLKKSEDEYLSLAKTISTV